MPPMLTSIFPIVLGQPANAAAAVVLQNLRAKGIVGDRSLRPPRLLGDGKQSQEGKEYLTLF